jgi:hypothetical protein
MNIARRTINDLEAQTRYRLDMAARSFCWEGAHARLQQLAAMLQTASGDERAAVVAEGREILAAMRQNEEVA